MTDQQTPELVFGETPFDRMDHQELLLTTKRFYDALLSAKSALSLVSHDNASLFWGVNGTGGRALEKAKQSIEGIHQQYDEEDIYRAYYRYAPDLLYADSEYDIKNHWCVCDQCGKMLSVGLPSRSIAGESCQDHPPILEENCPGVFRNLQWSDLTPNK